MDGRTARFIMWTCSVSIAGNELRLPLPGLSPLDDGSQSADAHIDLILAVLSVCNKTREMVRFLIGDNYATNKFMATKMDVSLVGCASHRFNLAVKTFVLPFETLIEGVNELMVQLRHPNNHSVLTKLTDLNPVKRNVTRWSSTFVMPERYIRIRGEIKQVEAVEYLVPGAADHKKLLTLFTQLKKMDSVCKRLQRDEIDMAQIHVLFDSVLSYFPSRGDYLKPAAAIVHGSVFEAAVVKVINEGTLTSGKKKVLRPFEHVQSLSKKRKEREEDYASELLLDGANRRKKGRDATMYDPTVAKTPPTFNAVERLFSRCNFVLTPQRGSMAPANFEMLQFLRASSRMWDVTTVASVQEDN